ncbi:DNA-binding protein [Aliikangiella sp. IMCC44359]|uniref:DNA-binding protein n=1 Tax=Aliikangiella sp. IMCC44359 TaxID=3459125 RepID=UPI00403A945B
MARHGVSYEEAKQVFTTILIQGESLSIQRARESYGSGSNSTWQQHLAKFREEQKGKAIRTLPDSFPEELVPMFEQLWVKANEAAEKRFEQEQSLAKEKDVIQKKEVQTLEAKIESLQENLAKALENNEYLEGAQAQLDQTLNEKEQQFIRINTKNNAQIESLISKNKELLRSLDEFKKANEQLIMQHENAIKEINIKHSNELVRVENNEAKWLNLYDEAKQNTKQLNKKLDELTMENSKLRSLEKEKISVDTELRVNKEQLKKVELKGTKLESINDQLIRDNESLKIQLDNTKKANLKFTEEIKQLKKRGRLSKNTVKKKPTKEKTNN